MDSITQAPASIPSITVRGRAYTLKFSLLAQFKISDMGLDPNRALLSIVNKQPDAIAMAMKLLVGFTAHNFVEAGQPIPPAEWWASVIPEEDWGVICEAMGKALPKPKPPMEAVQTAAPLNGEQIPN
jgi:hypothetical protein